MHLDFRCPFFFYFSSQILPIRVFFQVIKVLYNFLRLDRDAVSGLTRVEMYK